MSNKFRFHILGLPHTVTSKEYNACAYTQKVLKFGKMMKARGHEIIHYGHEDSNLICDEHVTVVTNADWQKAYGSYDWRKNFFKFDVDDHAYRTFYANAIREIGKRKKENDFILPFWGHGVKPVCDAHPDITTVEPGIGYPMGHWAQFKAFESYAIMHAYYGLAAVGNCMQSWYDVVIPNYFDPTDFEFREKKDNYFLFLGRVYEGKGFHIAVETTGAIGEKLIIAGQKPEEFIFPDHVEFVGYADSEKRKKLMAGAKGAFVPSLYIEPFGGVQVEMLMSGTPTITTDWGSFVENNIHGVTGYRCRTFDHFVWAAQNIDRIDPRNCRTWAENFTLDRVAPIYEEFFQNIMDVKTSRGWYERHSRNDLVYLKREYPKLPERMNHGVLLSEEKPMANRIALWAKENLKPESVLDVGCGPGHFVESMIDAGLNARGIDIDERVKGKPYLEYKSMFDLIDEQADLTLCIEVAEHIEESRADEIVDTIFSVTAKYCIWTAAQVGQGGIGHINCQPKDYWLNKFLAKGMTRDVEMEHSLLDFVKKDIHMGWFINNLILFKK